MPANLPYPFQFDPSQWKDPYTQWAGIPLPDEMATVGPSGLFGGTAPTNAYGQAIPSYTMAAAAAQAQYAQQQAAYEQQLAAYNNAGGAQTTPGTTINNTGLADLSARVDQNTINSANAMLDNSIAAGTAPGYSGRGAETGIANYPGAADALIGLASYQQQANKDYANGVPLGMPQQAAAAGYGMAPTPPQQPNMTQAYIAALQNPGHVTTPGATVAQAPSPSQQSNVLQNFVANWKPGVNPAGNYNNKPIIDAMRENV
jgi:hypothetical protein